MELRSDELKSSDLLILQAGSENLAPDA